MSITGFNLRRREAGAKKSEKAEEKPAEKAEQPVAKKKVSKKKKS